jgi:hypothetical protein
LGRGIHFLTTGSFAACSAFTPGLGLAASTAARFAASVPCV